MIDLSALVIFKTVVAFSSYSLAGRSVAQRPGMIRSMKYSSTRNFSARSSTASVFPNSMAER